MTQYCHLLATVAGFLLACSTAVAARGANVPLGGFIPLVGMGLSDEFETFDSDPTGLYNIADPSFSWGGSPLGPGSSAYFDLALLDTGASAHILTQAAASASGFGIQAEGFRGTNFQTIFGAVGPVDLRVNDPLGVYVAGLGDRTAAGTALAMNTAVLRGQTSVATLEASASWGLPNVLGLPMAAQHGIAIRNDQPQIFQHQGRTVRTPQVEFIDLGTGGQQGIARRTNLRLRPSTSFLTGPAYLPNLDLGGGLEFNFHDNPLSPTVVENGGLYVDVDLKHRGGDYAAQNVEFLLDTGADLTVMSQVMAASLGFDVLLDKPDFLLEVEGAGGVSSGVPGFYLDELKIDAVGGSLVLEHVPIAVLDVPNPVDPANVIDAILGTHVFTGRNLVIDAVPAASGQGSSPSLYISDPVTETHSWASTAASGSWGAPTAWSSPGTPSALWDAQVKNVTGGPQTVNVGNSTVYRLTVGGGAGSATMTLNVDVDATLTAFGETLIETGGRINLASSGINRGRLDAQFVNIDGGTLSGEGSVFVGAGPVSGAVRNLAGRVEPSTSGSQFGTGVISITGDFANLADATLAIDLGGEVAGAMHDKLVVSRYAFLGGTLEVRLVDAGTPFVPNVGDSFTILTADSGIVGKFDALLLPGGFQWKVDYLANSVELSVAALAALAGDFNGSGAVDGADLVAWQTGFGPQYNGADFLAWQRNSGGGSLSAVPEPTAGGLLLLLGLAACTRRRSGGSLSRG